MFFKTFLLLFTQFVIAAELKPATYFEIHGLHVRDFTLSVDGQEFYTTMESIGKDASQIIKLKKTPTGWSEPEIASFSGQFKDLEPFLHPNGLQLFFASNRNLEQSAATEQFDIWMVERTTSNDDWGKPIKLNEHINTPDANEFYPSVSNNGNLYFTASKNNGLGKEDIYVSRLIDGQYSQAEILPETVNTATYEFNAYISPDEKILLFSSFGRQDGMGGGDLYLSHRVNDEWQQAQNLGDQINSKQLDYCPFYDAKAQTLYWTSARSQLKSMDDQPKNYQQWLKLYTTGENGLSKIYSTRISLAQ
ncbi:MAG: hypothetical protein R3E90_16200 [Marinicella sp.]